MSVMCALFVPENKEHKSEQVLGWKRRKSSHKSGRNRGIPYKKTRNANRNKLDMKVGKSEQIEVTPCLSDTKSGALD